MPRRRTMPDAVLWKDEGRFGPVWVRREGVMSNYEDSDLVGIGGKPVPKWFSRSQARAIARRENLPFEEV